MAKRRPNGDGMVRKRADGRWEGAVVIGHKADGSYLYKWVQARTQKELMPKLHCAIEAYRGVDLTEESRMTLGEWFGRWFKDYAEVTLRPSTVRGYRIYEKQINRYLGDKQISLITTQQIQRMYNKLKRDGREVCREKYGTGLSDSSVRSIHMLLHEVMEAAVQARLIAKNPTAGTKIPKCNYPDKKILNEAELAVFTEAIEREPLWRDFFYTEITTGLRRGEICGLKWSDLDIEKGTLKVERSISNGKGGKLEIGETKTEKGKRIIRLPASTLRILTERKECALNDWIFPNLLEPEKPMNPSTAYGKLKSILKAAGLPDIRFHDLRHIFATMAIANGMDVKTLSATIGHVSATTTLDIYSHRTAEMEIKAAENIERGIGKSEPSTVPLPEKLREEPPKEPSEPFTPYKGKIRKSGSGCIYKINDHLYEGSFSPTHVGGKRVKHNVYAETRAEVEVKLVELIKTIKAEIAAEKKRAKMA